jgi:hypothetical protein
MSRKNFTQQPVKYTFFSVVYGTILKIDHILGHKVSLNKFKKIEIIPCMISHHKGIKLISKTKETTESIQTHGD